MDNTGYVVAGYLITLLSLGGYALSVVVRARRARARVEALSRRGPDGGARGGSTAVNDLEPSV